MSLTLRRSIVAAALVVPLLASCAIEEPTDQIYTPAVGVNDRSGTVDVLNALIVSDTDGRGTVIAGLVNNDQEEADVLTGITGSGEDAGVTVAGGLPVRIKPGASVQLADEGAVSAEGRRIAPGAFVELTFSFQRGSSVTVQVPVVARRGDFADVPVPAEPSPSESPSPPESPSPSESPSETPSETPAG